MRLLHTTRLEFEEFYDDQIPRYAILSHRWGRDEVSYQDFLAGRKLDGAGDKKILACCRYAAGDRDMGPINWVWIDTCCIDKSSSAELAEAINSMFRWYQNASICYAYLSDVKKSNQENLTKSEFESSQWFTRGWTLQELIAPQKLIFLDREWAYIGTRDNYKASIAKSAKIDACRIGDSIDPLTEYVSVAEKLSWAAERVTSRQEDQAYCLLGLFEINMPLLYGEGIRAFDRLQNEIIRSSNDESIFVWDAQPFSSTSYGRVLADSPIRFRTLHSRRGESRAYGKLHHVSRAPFAITNQDLEFRVPKRLAQKGRFLLPFNCLCFGAQRHVRGAFAILLSINNIYGFWERIFKPNLDDSTAKFRYSESSSLYVVPADWVWSRESLAEEESEVIYLRISY